MTSVQCSTEILDSNVIVISKKGKVLGCSQCEGVPLIGELIEQKVGTHIDGMLNERLLSILSTKENVNLETLGFSAGMNSSKDIRQLSHRSILQESGWGTLFIYKINHSMRLTISF